VRKNPGHLPPEAAGKRVNVVLNNGRRCANWAADGRDKCNWHQSGHPYDIAEWELSG